MAKVFVSYSRKDIEFAKQLTTELKKSELDFWIDWEGIPPTVDWWKEIEKGIEEADVFLFLISPDSARSKICGQEIETAVKNGKRIIPIVVREIEWQDTPPQLGHLNYIFFSRDDDFETAVKKLLTAIQTDYEWAATHRRLQVKALEWERNHKENSFLLRGKDLQEAEFQLATNTSKEPHPTDLQRDFVHQSRRATDRQRQAITSVSLLGLILLASLALYAFTQARNAEKETRRAIAGKLAAESKNALSSYPQRALLLALEAVRTNQVKSEPILPEAEEALRYAVEAVPGIGLEGFEDTVYFVDIIQDNTEGKNSWLVASGGKKAPAVRIWNMDKLINDPAYRPFSISSSGPLIDSDGNEIPILTEISPQGTWLVTKSEKGYNLWVIADILETRTPVNFQSQPFFPNPDDDNLVVEQNSGEDILWRIDPSTLQKTEIKHFNGKYETSSMESKCEITGDPDTLSDLLRILHDQPLTLGMEGDITTCAISPDSKWLVAGASDGTLRLWNYEQPWSSRIQLDQSPGDPFQSKYIALSNNNKWLAIGSNIWKLENGIPVKKYILKESRKGTSSSSDSFSNANVGVFSPDSHWFIHLQTSGEPGTDGNSPTVNISLLDMTKDMTETVLVPKIINPPGSIYNIVQFSPNSKWMVVSLYNGYSYSYKSAFIFNLEDRSYYSLPYSPLAAVYTSDQKYIILLPPGVYNEFDGSYSTQSPEIWAFPVKSSDALRRIGNLDVDINGKSAFSPNGRWLLAGNKLWDINCFIEKYECKPVLISTPIEKASFSPDSRYLMLGWQNAEEVLQPFVYEIWDMRPWEYDNNSQPVKIYSNSTPLLDTSIGNSGSVIVLQKDEECASYSRQSVATLSSGWQRGSDLLNRTTFDGYAFLSIGIYGGFGGGESGYHIDYNVEALSRTVKGYLPINLRGHESSVSTTEVSPNERFVLTYTGGPAKDCEKSESLLRLWNIDKMKSDPSTNPVILPIEGGISHLAFSPNSEWIYLIDFKNILYYFPVSIDALQLKACREVGRNFIVNEWERFFPHDNYRKTCDNLPVHPSSNDMP